MTNHVHLVIFPERETSPSLLLRRCTGDMRSLMQELRREKDRPTTLRVPGAAPAAITSMAREQQPSSWDLFRRRRFFQFHV